MGFKPIHPVPGSIVMAVNLALHRTIIVRHFNGLPPVEIILLTDEEWQGFKADVESYCYLKKDADLKGKKGPEVGEFMGLKVFLTDKPILKRFITEQEYKQL